MDEASSKYVDQIATEKLLDLKLRKVRHQPTEFYPPEIYSLNQIELRDLVRKHEAQARVIMEQGVLSYSSCINTKYPGNDQSRCFCYPAKSAKGEIIFIHGLYEDNRQIYQYLISELNKQGFNVYLYILPFHYERKPAASLFSGEYFLCADIYRSLLAFKQAVYDLYFLYGYLKQKRQQKVILVGFSMGGGISLLLSALIGEIDGFFVINPVVCMAELIWERPLCATIKADLVNYGITFAELKKVLQGFEPLENYHSGIPSNRIRMVQGIYDQINDPRDYQRFAVHWKLPELLNYKAGHLNVLRVPRLSQDIAEFYFQNPNHQIKEGVAYELL